ncbi:hypothetical protein ES702_02346 [subsurface metagenome]
MLEEEHLLSQEGRVDGHQHLGRVDAMEEWVEYHTATCTDAYSNVSYSETAHELQLV